MTQDAAGRPATRPTADLGARLRIGAALIVAALLALFFLQNLQHVEIHFLWFDWNTRLLWALIASSAIGAVAIGLIITLLGRRKRPTTTRINK